MNSDETLWNGMLNGDQEMFLSLYQKYYHTLLFVGLKEVKDAQLVKDSIQHLFFYLWEKRDTLHQAKNVKSYLLISFLRKLSADWKKNCKTSALRVADSESSPDPAPTPEESLIRKDEEIHLIRHLAAYINELPNRQKELIFLRFYEGLSYAEIVERTGLSQRTVYNSIHEALKRLKLEIGDKKTSRNISLLSLTILLVSSAETFK